MQKIYWIISLCLALLLSACNNEEDKIKTVGSRTVLVYMAAENSLSDNKDWDVNLPLPDADVSEMEAGAKSLPDNVNLILFWDSPKTNSKLYRIDKSGRKEIKDYGADLVSTDISVLKRVLSDTESMYPAGEYAMVMWSHATGWQPENLTTTGAISRSFGQDTNSGSLASQIDIPDLANALQGFPKFKYIMFDACFMQCIEVAYDLRNVTDYILGAPCEIPGTGAYYNKLVPAMFSSNFVQDLVNNYYQPYIEENKQNPTGGYGAVMAALDCSQVDNFTAVTKDVLPEYSADKSLDIDLLQTYIAYYNVFPWTKYKISPYYDIKGQMKQILSADDFQKWEAALNKLIVSKGTTDTFFTAYSDSNITVDKDKFSGLAGYVPNMYPKCDLWDNLFRKTNWYEAAGWKEKGW